MIAYAAHTWPGRVRSDNQDRLATDAGRGTFVVADGIGGLADGALTAQRVVDELPGRVHARLEALTEPNAAAMAAAVTAELSEQVRNTARRGPGTTGAATALLLIRGDRALAVHLGDSRIYRTRGGRLVRLTDDHRLDGRLTRYVGMPGTAAPEVSVHHLLPGDRLLVCTDGLTAELDDTTLGGLLGAADDLARVAPRLVAAAVAAGTADDITLIVLDYLALDGTAAEDAATGKETR